MIIGSQSLPRNAYPTRHSPADDGVDAILDACILKAEELAQTLQEESETLRRLHSEKLLELLPRKEVLVRDLYRKVQALNQGKSENRDSGKEPRHLLLRNLLEAVNAMNRSNRILIENSLVYYNDFINCLCPAHCYGARQKPIPGPNSTVPKGLALRKEI